MREAERRMGELLNETPRATGAKGVGPIAVTLRNRNDPPTLSELGITKRESAKSKRADERPLYVYYKLPRCPVCKNTRLRTEHTERRQSGQKVRHARCLDCRCKLYVIPQ